MGRDAGAGIRGAVVTGAPLLEFKARAGLGTIEVDRDARAKEHSADQGPRIERGRRVSAMEWEQQLSRRRPARRIFGANAILYRGHRRRGNLALVNAWPDLREQIEAQPGLFRPRHGGARHPDRRWR